MQVIKVKGLASGNVIELKYESWELGENLLKWLRSRGITVASSCDGEGVCRKCIIQNDWLTCMLTLRTLLENEPSGKIEISYL